MNSKNQKKNDWLIWKFSYFWTLKKKYIILMVFNFSKVFKKNFFIQKITKLEKTL